MSTSTNSRTQEQARRRVHRYARTLGMRRGLQQPHDTMPPAWIMKRAALIPVWIEGYRTGLAAWEASKHNQP